MENKENIFPSLGYVCVFFEIAIRLQEVSHFITLDAFFSKHLWNQWVLLMFFQLKSNILMSTCNQTNCFAVWS